MRDLMGSWQFWAFGSAVFAALTAILAKVGVSGIPSDLATLIRTVVILVIVALVAWLSGAYRPPGTIATTTWVFLVLSGLATGASWLCYFRALKIGEAAKVAPVDKLSVVLVAIFGIVFLGERLSAASLVGVVMIAAGGMLVAFAG